MRRILLLILCFCFITVHSQQWVISSIAENGVVLQSGDCNGDGNYIFGACDNGPFGYMNAFAMYVDNYGAFNERRFDFGSYKSHLCNAICLEDGNAFVIGVKGGTMTDHLYDTLWVMIMTPELEIIEERNYPVVAPYITWTTDMYLELNNYGEIIVLADVSEKNYPYVTNGVYAVFKMDLHGNMIKSRYFPDGHGVNGARPTGIIRVPDSDYMMMLGKGFFVNGFHSICYIDNELNKVAAYPLSWLEDNWNHTDYWKDNGHFLMSSMTHHQGGGIGSYYAAVFEVDNQGRYIDTLVYDRADTSDYTAQFGSMAYVDDETIYIATYWENGDDEMPSDAVICLIDRDLNLRGIKKLKVDDTKIRLMHCQKTSDGGCLVYGRSKKSYGSELLCVWKLSVEDFVIPYTLYEMPGVLRHQEVYPNPTNGILNLIVDYDNQDCKVIISDQRGRKFFERKFERPSGVLTLDLSTLEKGVYIYEVFTRKNCTQKGKFIKN